MSRSHRITKYRRVFGEALGADDTRPHHPRIHLLDPLGDAAQFHRRTRGVVQPGEQEHGVVGAAEHLV